MVIALGRHVQWRVTHLDAGFKAWSGYVHSPLKNYFNNSDAHDELGDDPG